VSLVVGKKLRKEKEPIITRMTIVTEKKKKKKNPSTKGALHQGIRISGGSPEKEEEGGFSMLTS